MNNFGFVNIWFIYEGCGNMKNLVQATISNYIPNCGGFHLYLLELAFINQFYTANVLTIKIMDFDHVPNPGIMSP